MDRGNIATRRQCTARVLITPPGQSALKNLGDLKGHKKNLSRDGTEVSVAEKGFRRIISNLTSLVGLAYDFTLLEQFGVVNELSLMGTKGADTTQAAVTAPSGTFSFNGVKQGYSYQIGKYNLDNFVVTSKALGVDYEIDLGSGELYIIPGGTIADASNIAGTFGCAQVIFENYTMLDKAGRQSGYCEIHEFDQHDSAGVPVRVVKGNFQYWIEGGEEHDGKKIAEQTFKLLATSKPSVIERK
jgi:hypothetical protein